MAYFNPFFKTAHDSDSVVPHLARILECILLFNFRVNSNGFDGENIEIFSSKPNQPNNGSLRLSLHRPYNHPPLCQIAPLFYPSCAQYSSRCKPTDPSRHIWLDLSLLSLVQPSQIGCEDNFVVYVVSGPGIWPLFSGVHPI